jgi:tubulin polyglutamylase TTLL9
MERVDALFWEIQMIMLRSLLAVQPIMISDRHCFEMYGYDIIIDQDLKPWLLEVNASPSLTANTREDYLMKTEMLHGMLDVVDMEQQLSGDEEHVSGWDLVYDDGFIEINREKCGYSTFLGTAIPESGSSGGSRPSRRLRGPGGGAARGGAEGGSEDEEPGPGARGDRTEADI